MKSLNKNKLIMVRMNRELFKRLGAQAKAEAVRRGERLASATLARELILRGLDQLEAEERQPVLALPAEALV